MIANVSIDWLPDLYGGTLELWDAGKDDPGYKQLTGNGGVPKFMALYAKIRKDGWAEKPYIWGTVSPEGHFMLRGGYHRASILRRLGHRFVSVDVRKSDGNFKRFHETLYKLQGEGNFTYHPLEHWAVSAWPTERGTNRADIINRHVEPDDSILDIGCYTGGMSHWFAVRGHRVTGVERNADALFCAEYLAGFYASAEGMAKKWTLELGHLTGKYKGYVTPIFVCMNIDEKLVDGGFDRVLFLSVYRWLKEPERVVKAIGKIAKKSVFVDDKDPKPVLNAFRKWTDFRVAERIGVESGGGKRYHRPLYELRRG